MPEKKQNTNFADGVRRHSAIAFFRQVYAFVRWLAAGIFTMLLVAAILLAAPWRVCLLLAIVPAGVFFLPRDLQKWCWIALGMIFIGTYAWVRCPDQNSSLWRPYVFAWDNKSGSTASSENAAPLYDEIMSRHHEDIFPWLSGSEELILTYLFQWNEKQYPEQASQLDSIAADLQRLAAAAHMPYCFFAPPTDMASLAKQQKRLNTTKAMARLLMRSANRDLFNKHYSKSLSKQLTLLQMARHGFDQQTLLDCASGFFLERMARRSLSYYIVENADANDLETIAAEIKITRPAWPACWEGILDGEKTLTTSVSGLFYQSNCRGDVRFSRNLPEALRLHLGYQSRRFPLSSELSRILVLGMSLTLPSTPEGAARLIGQRFDRLSDRAAAGYDIEKYPDHWTWLDGLNAAAVIDSYARELVAYFYPLNDQNWQLQRGHGALSVLVAIRQFRLNRGQWPESLSPINRAATFCPEDLWRDLIYRRTQAGFILYLPGQNGRDDGGVNDPLTKQDDIVYWPPLATSGPELRLTD